MIPRPFDAPSTTPATTTAGALAVPMRWLPLWKRLTSVTSFSKFAPITTTCGHVAYETRRHFPQERIWITNEIIHNPSVNRHLRQMGVLFIPMVQGSKDFSAVEQGDVVILPAFGATVDEMKLLNQRQCTISGYHLPLGF